MSGSSDGECNCGVGVPKCSEALSCYMIGAAFPNVGRMSQQSMSSKLKLTSNSVLGLSGFEPYKECQFAEFSGDGSRLLTVQESEDGIARLWSCESGLQLCTLEPTSALTGRDDLSIAVSESFAVFIESIALDMTGRYALLGLNDGTAGVFDCETGERLSVMHLEEALPTDYGTVNSVAFSREGSLTLAAFPGGRVGVFDATGGVLLGVLSLPSSPRRGKVVSLSVSEDGEYVFAGLSNSEACLWRLRDFSLVSHCIDHRDTTVQLCSSGDRIYWATSAGKIWCCDPGAVPVVLTCFDAGIEEAQFALNLENDEQTLALVRLVNGEIVRIKRDGARETLSCAALAREAEWRNDRSGASIVPLLDGSFLFSSPDRESAAVCKYSLKEGVRSLPLQRADLQIAFLCISPGQAYVAVAYENCSKFDVLDLRTDTVIASSQIEDSILITALSFSTDEDLLAIGADKSALLCWWSLRKNEFVQRSDVHSEAITCLEFGSSGDSLVSASEDRTVRLWKRTMERASFRTVGGEAALVSFASILRSGHIFLLRSVPELWSADLKELVYRAAVDAVQAFWIDEERDSLLVSSDGVVNCLQLSTGALLERIEVEAVRPGTLPAIGMKALSSALFWQLPGGPYLHLPETFRGVSCPMRLSADGRMTVVPCVDGAVLIGTAESQPLTEPIFLPCRSDRQPLSGSFISGDRVLLFCRNGNLLQLVFEEEQV